MASTWWDPAKDMAQTVAGTSLSMSNISLGSVNGRNVLVGDEIVHVLKLGAAGVDLAGSTSITATNTIQVAVSTTSMVLLVVTRPPGP